MINGLMSDGAAGGRGHYYCAERLRGTAAFTFFDPRGDNASVIMTHPGHAPKRNLRTNRRSAS